MTRPKNRAYRTADQGFGGSPQTPVLGRLGIFWGAPLLTALVLVIWPLSLGAQTRSVDPADLSLSVSVIEQQDQPYTREMVMILIRGVYRRHITLEELHQPALEGFNWTQLGPDLWYDERENGRKVKVMERRMALYPERAGALTIGPFTHHLTLTDESDNWFDHQIQSDPVTLNIAPAPALEEGGWWFPAKQVQIADQWSNAPDQLRAGEGVLRIIRIEALGVTPEMIPPMPELKSPSAMIFAHPEKRLVELSPEGPVSYAFWRWTIRPGNDHSGIVEPLHLSFFDTRERVMRDVTISAQRVAYDMATLPPGPAPRLPVALPGWPVALLGIVVFVLALVLSLSGRQADLRRLQRRFWWLDPLARGLRRAAARGEAAATRAKALALLRRDGLAEHSADVLRPLDQALFAPGALPPDLPRFARDILRVQRRGSADRAKLKTKR